jgi:prepilin-type N-terminal cleavage/methylation domain-containing protein
MRRREAGMTLLEILIAMAIMVTMMSLAWRTISNTADVKRKFEAFEERNHELRMAIGRIAADFEAAYLSTNEDQNATYRRTMFIAKSGSRFPEIRFSTLGHRVLWADANESEQTVISYLTRSDPERRNVTDLIRREQRRPSNEPPDEIPAEYDILLRDIQSLKLEFWNWKTFDWQDTWDTTQADGQKDWLPSRVRITVAIKDQNDKDYKLTTQARILMQEPLRTNTSKPRN